MATLPANSDQLQLEASASFDSQIIHYIQRAAATGLYEIRGLGAKRRLPHFDDLVFLGASLSRYPLEGYREKCSSATLLGTRYAKRPLKLAMPITIAGMSFGALSANVKEALGRAATELGTSTTTGDGGMTRRLLPLFLGELVRKIMLVRTLTVLLRHRGDAINGRNRGHMPSLLVSTHSSTDSSCRLAASR